MQIENSFEVGAAPDTVYQFLLDVNRVVACVPGAELSEVVDPNTFKGKVKIKVGPVTVAYAGTASIVERDEANRSAVLQGEGRETTGPGNARARATMSVTGSGTGSMVTVSTDFTVAGRVAQFGRGLMEDVSKSLVAQMAECIKSKLETPASPDGTASPHTQGAAPSSDASAPPAAGQGAKPVNALALLWSIIVARIRALFAPKAA
ncbi:MAG TPA: SRPBCC family protein [Candidatus Dormibacteraeota bacterium]|nr:SRPBCC family protein [Candidatus Dormibacteraeota bacterium]